MVRYENMHTWRDDDLRDAMKNSHRTMVPSTARVRDFCIGLLARESAVNAGFPLARSYVAFVPVDGIFKDHFHFETQTRSNHDVHCNCPLTL